MNDEEGTDDAPEETERRREADQADVEERLAEAEAGVDDEGEPAATNGPSGGPEPIELTDPSDDADSTEPDDSEPTDDAGGDSADRIDDIDLTGGSAETDSVDDSDSTNDSDSVDNSTADDDSAADSGEAVDPDSVDESDEATIADRLAAADVDADIVAQVETLTDRVDALESELDDRESELDDRSDRIDDLESKLKRKQADFENYKKRAKKRQDQIEERATEDLVTRLLDVRDNLKRALDQEDADVEDLREGVRMTLSEFDRVLDDERVTEIDPEPGTDVDPQRHEVLMRVESGRPEDTVADVHRPGYEMADKVLRAAQVTVSDGDDESSREGDGEH